MKKIMNSPSDFVKETIEGILLAYPDKLKISEENNRVILSKYPHKKGKVGIVTGGGSGHLPVFLGYVGDGMGRWLRHWECFYFTVLPGNTNSYSRM